MEGHGFKAADRGDGLAEDLGPALDGGQANAKAGERAGAGGNGVEVDLSGLNGLLVENLLEMTEEAGGIRLVAGVR